MSPSVEWHGRISGLASQVVLSKSPRRPMSRIWQVEGCPVSNFQQDAGLDLGTLGKVGDQSLPATLLYPSPSG